VQFGKRAQARFGDATREGFYGIIDTIKALWWLRIGHQLGGDSYARAAKRFGVSRPTAFRIVHLYQNLDKIVRWAEDTACVQRQRRLTPTWPCVAEMLRRFPRSKGGSRRQSPVLKKLHATNLELTDTVTRLTGELAAAKQREAELRRTINEQNAQIERLENEAALAPRGRPSDGKGYVLTTGSHGEFGEMDDACSHTHPAGFDSLTRGPEGIKFTRVWAMPCARTFTIQPIKELLSRYEVGAGWLDPMAGDFSPAEFTNDHHPERRARWQMDVLEFAKLAAEMRPEGYDGGLFDPPFSPRQVSEHYKNLGRKATQAQTSMKFVSDARVAMARLIKPGGHVISFGWNSNGFGKRLGFKVIEILLVQHGGLSHDTIVTV
jgi:hypothetical protein